MTQQLVIALGCVIDRGRVLLIRRHEPSLPALHGYWELPGGRISIGEDPSHAAVREILEETGYRASSTVSLGAPFATLRKRSDGSRLHVIGVGFLCKLEGDPPSQFVPPSKVAEVSWVPLHELDPVRVQSGSLAFLAAAIQIAGEPVPKVAEYQRVRRASITLQSIAPEENRRRYYHISIQGYLSDLPEFRVLRYWGRGLPSQVKIDEFTARDEMAAFVNRHLRKRAAHRYEVLETSPEFPSALFPIVPDLPKAPVQNRQIDLFEFYDASNPSSENE